jgi:four helix bundle protein
MTYTDFTQMPIWQNAMDIAVNIQQKSIGFPKTEDYGVTSQLRRAALSIASNLAEGFGRSHTKDKLNFYYFSRGSIMETRNHLIYCKNVKYMNEEDVRLLNETLLQLTYDLNKLIKSLQSKL